MFTDLAVIDWIALVFAALLLSAAAAASVIAYATSSRRPKGTTLSTGRASRPQHAARPQSKATTSATVHAMGTSSVVSKPTDSTGPADQSSGSLESTKRSNLDTDESVAARAAKLRRAPVAEKHAPEVRSPSPAMSANRLHANVKSLKPKPETGALTLEHFDTVAGFKARNPGFFDDPMGRHELRYWDGHAWTEYVKEHGERFTDPL